MIIYDSPQGSDEWKKEKAGKFSASKATELLMKPSTAGYQNLISQIAYERFTGEPVETYINQDMRDGIENEPIAREAYELLTYNKVHQVGFMELNSWVGMSSDGLIGTDGGTEIKCVKWNTQIEYLLNQKVPTKYFNQTQFQMFVSGRKWIDWFSWHPKLPPVLIRVDRDNSKIEEIQDALSKAIKEVEKIINALSK